MLGNSTWLGVTSSQSAAMSAGTDASAALAQASAARRATSDWMCGPKRSVPVMPSAKNG
ncbi:MAG: hypothetical protein ABI281_14530 [Caldimonas sp.]